MAKVQSSVALVPPMSTPNTNVDTLRRCYDRWSETRGRSIEDWLEIVGPKFRTRSAAGHHVEGRLDGLPAGPDGLRTYLQALVNTWIMERHDVERFIADGDQVAAVIRAVWRNRETNKRIATDVVDLWVFDNGKAVSMLELFDTAAMIEAATPDLA